MSEFKDIIEANFREYRKQFQSAGLIIVASLILIGLFTAVYTVQAEMQGVVLRFGKFITTVEPGLRFKFPFGIDRVQMVPVRRQLKQEFGFGTQGASNNSQYSSPREWEHEKNMVTGDLNAASVEWIVQYRINDPRQFLFNVREPGNTLRAVFLPPDGFAQNQREFQHFLDALGVKIAGVQMWRKIQSSRKVPPSR
ncbi:MAG: SPFH domain-containing protein [Verrucomicrobiota bacterium]|nr:SPFH domain-containing protein [Verrucomicrobiota bacterium]